MKRTLILLALASGFVITGCKKYVDGPGFTINSPLCRIAQEWEVDSVDINGLDYTSFYDSVFLDIRRDGNATWKFPLGNILGTWAFNSDETMVIFTATATSQQDSLNILRLTKKEFVSEEVSGSNVTTYKMIPRPE